MAPRPLLMIAALLVAIALLAMLAPHLSGAVRLNLASASLVHSLSLPADAPDRAAGLLSAERHVQFSDAALPRGPLAAARVALGQGDAAGAYVHLATLSDPDALSLFIRANTAWHSGNAVAAIDDWRRSGAYTYFREQVVRELGGHDWPAAARDAEIAAAIEPSNATAHLAFADALSHQMPVPSRATQELDLALQLTRSSEERSTILSLQGELLAREGKLDQAESRFEDAIQLAPNDARPRTGLASVLLQRNPTAPDEAIALLQQVVSDSPWYTVAYSRLSDCAEKNGDLSGAESWLLKGLQSNRNNPYLLFRLGDWYSRHGQNEKGIATLISALKYETHPDELQEIASRLAEVSTP